MKKVITIEPVKQSDINGTRNIKLRVAAYCRVSTSNIEQINSYEAQREFYSKSITANPAWELVDIYADEGISGTSKEKRSDFLRLIGDCEQMKIDLVAIHLKRYKNDDYEFREPLFGFSAKLYCETCGATFYRYQVRMKGNIYVAQWKCRNHREHVENDVVRPTICETEIEEVFVEVLQEMAKDLKSLFKKPANEQVIDCDIKALDSEIYELLSSSITAAKNKELISELITRRAYLQFERANIDDFDYQTGKIKRMLADKNLMDKAFDAVFFRGVIDKVTIGESVVCFQFLNGYKVSKQYQRKVGSSNGSKKR